MNHTFCMHCGFKIVYNNAKPNFCPACGQSIGAAAQSSTHTAPVKRASQRIIEEDELEEDETNSDYVPEIRKLQVELEPDSPNRSFTFGSLFGEESSRSPSRKRSVNIDEFIDAKKR
jgi:predicted RNA-binding Zn-ribbon protein involved in translation (DUF1610 family)